MYFNFGTGHTFNMYWHRHTLRIIGHRSCPEAHILIRQNKNAVLVKFLHYSNSYYNYVTKTITIYSYWTAKNHRCIAYPYGFTDNNLLRLKTPG